MKLGMALAAALLLVLGILLVLGVLDFLLRILGVICIMVAVGLIIVVIMSRNRRY